ncbi:MAG: tetratricopeptide repeat protein, partial [Gemmatimonadota bacterium]
RGEVDGGEQVLREFCDRHRDTDVALEALILLGQYQSSIERLDKGIATIESARPLQSGDREADRALAGLLAANDRVEQALELCVEMLKSGSDLGIQLLAVDCHARLEQFDEAGMVLRKVIDAEGSSVTTAMLLASIAFGQGDQAYDQEKFDEAERRYAEGREALAQAQRMEPSNPLPHVQLARSLLSAFGRTGEQSALDKGLLALARADEAQGSTESISMVRAELLLAKEDPPFRGAVGELSRLLERFPGNDAARRRLLFLHAANQDFDGAMAVVVAGIERNPLVAYWHEAMGDVHVRQRDLEPAAASFARAQELEPSLNRVYKLAQASLALEEPDFVAIVEALEAYADSLENRPGVRTVYAHALGGVNRRDEAIAQLRIAYAEYRTRIENNPSAPHYRGRWFGTVASLFSTEGVRGIEPFLRELAGGDLDPFELDWLAEVWAGEGAEGMMRAIELQRQAVGRCPEDEQRLRAQFLFKLGQFILVTGDARTAVGTFEEVIGIIADHAAALNNAAYIYAELLDEPAKAVPYAEEAAKATPTDPNVLDTLGWAYFKAGRNDEAEDALRKSITAEPSAENHLHLAHVLVKAARLQTAENYLRRAAELDPNAQTRAEIDRLANEITPRLGNRGSQ